MDLDDFKVIAHDEYMPRHRFDFPTDVPSAKYGRKTKLINAVTFLLVGVALLIAGWIARQTLIGGIAVIVIFAGLVALLVALTNRPEPPANADPLPD